MSQSSSQKDGQFKTVFGLIDCMWRNSSVSVFYGSIWDMLCVAGFIWILLSSPAHHRQSVNGPSRKHCQFQTVFGLCHGSKTARLWSRKWGRLVDVNRNISKTQHVLDVHFLTQIKARVLDVNWFEFSLQEKSCVMGCVPDVDRLFGLILLKPFCWRLLVWDVDRLLCLILLKSFCCGLSESAIYDLAHLK